MPLPTGLLILRRHGRIREAADLCRQALSSQPAKEGKAEKSLPYIGVVYASLGLILLEWNDLDAAGPALTRSLELSRLMAAADGQLDSFIGLARLRQAQGDFTGAMELLDQVELDSDKATVLVPAMRVRLYLARSYEQPHFLRKALAWAEGKSLISPVLWWQVTDVLTLARVLVAQRWSAAQSPDVPLPELDSLMHFLAGQLESAESKDLTERRIELLILQALAWQAQNHLPEALDSLRQALVLAEPGGYIRLFVDEGLPMRRLLIKLKGNGNKLIEYISKLLAAGGWNGTVPSPGVSQPAMIEQLSPRELEVLELLAEGDSNTDIARKLVITLNTTKKHVTHIFEKLAVSGRAEAAARARELGLLKTTK